MAKLRKRILYLPPAMNQRLVEFQSMEETVPGILKLWIRDISTLL
jgi:hypothetical protein